MTPQRVNRYMAWLRHVLNLVVREGKLVSNPVSKLKMFKEPKGKTRFFSMEEEALLLDKLGSVHGPWARLAILTGLRQAEQFRLQWKEVDLERGILTLPTTKAGGVQYAHSERRGEIDLAEPRFLAVVEVGVSVGESRYAPGCPKLLFPCLDACGHEGRD